VSEDLVVQRPEGLYCPQGDFHIDPWRPVPRAVITHAHADHARRGHGAYLATAVSEPVLRARLGPITLQGLAYGEGVQLGDVRLSLHPAGHVLGSAQLRIEHRGQVWVASGDYFHSASAAHNPSCTPFEPVPCHCFITECTFGLPVYRWQPQRQVLDDVQDWWRGNARAGRTSLLLAYSLGKAQHVLSALDGSIGPLVVHDTVQAINEAYRAAGVALPATRRLQDLQHDAALGHSLVIAPPGALGSPWARGLGEYSDAFASGWMQLRTARRRQGLARGFALSDHADWPGLLAAIAASGAERVIVTHGDASVLLRWLQRQGLQAGSLRTEYGHDGEASADAASPGP